MNQDLPTFCKVGQLPPYYLGNATDSIRLSNTNGNVNKGGVGNTDKSGEHMEDIRTEDKMEHSKEHINKKKNNEMKSKERPWKIMIQNME